MEYRTDCGTKIGPGPSPVKRTSRRRPGPRGCGLSRLVLQHELPQEFEADRTRSDHARMEVLEAEGGAVALPELLAQVHDDALAHLVGDRLAGPAHVTRDFARGVLRVLEGALLHQLDAEVVVPRLARVERRLFHRHLEAQVAADVDHHAAGAE